MTSQEYVSKELTHFVGRNLPEDDKRYELLVRILTEGWLLADPENQWGLWPHYQEDAFPLNMEISLPEDKYQPAFQPHAVCFCDIPLKELSIHMSKYGRFGLSFSKSFIVKKGANPVFYIAQNAKPVSAFHETRHKYFQEELKRYLRMWQRTGVPSDQRAAIDTRHLHTFLAYHVFGYMKIFDDDLPEEDPLNFYMEREWRKLGNVKFELNDVHRVILPHSYVERYRKDLPEYLGEVTRVNPHETSP